MADSKLLRPTDASDDTKDLIHCGICHAIIDKPKALPCLHTYCFKCLSNWSQSSAEKDPGKYKNAISCPSCRETFPLPEGGVKELRNNFFVSRLKERNSLEKKLNDTDVKIACSSCDESDESEAIAHCVECNDFLCKLCVKNHKSMRVLKQHHVLTLEELRAGKLVLRKIPYQEACPKHPEELLRFYCETCEEPICRDCTVVVHPRPEHKQTDLKSAATDRSSNLQVLLKCSEATPDAIDVVMEENCATLDELKANVEEAISTYKETAKKAEAEFIKKMREIEASRETQIKVHQKRLELKKDRICNALETTRQVTEDGSEHDIATMYPSLHHAMQQVCRVNPKAVTKSISKIKFAPSENLDGLSSLGVLHTYIEWDLETSQFGGDTLTSGKSIVVAKNGKIAISHGVSRLVRVADEDGGSITEFATNVSGDVSSSPPYGLAVGDDGSYFITDTNPYVKVFVTGGTFLRKFSVQNPEGTLSTSNASQLHGLAIDKCVYVGCTNHKYISIHKQDGTRVSGFEVKLRPYSIAITPEDHIIVGSYNDVAVHAYHADGSQLYKVRAPRGGFNPSGLCIIQGEIYVASYSTNNILRYTLSGDLIGPVTGIAKKVSAPQGMAISENGEKLFICDSSGIKVFSRK